MPGRKDTLVVRSREAIKQELWEMFEHVEGSMAEELIRKRREEAAREEPDTLTADSDALLAAMQTAAARAGMRAAFGASPQELGRTAAAAAVRED